MIYLTNSRDIQDVYIPRQDIINVTKQGIDLSQYLTSGQTIELINESIESATTDFVTSGEVQTQIDEAVSGIPREFKTINGETIIGEGNIEIDGAIYTAGENIEISEENVISVTGITIPDVSQFITSGDAEALIDAATSDLVSEAEIEDFVTSADVKTQIEEYHYITSGDIPTSNTAFTNDAGYLTEHQSLSAYSTTDEVETMIENAIPDVSQFVTSGEVQSQINDSISGIPTEFKTINGSGITGTGNIQIDGAVYSAGTNISISEQNVISVTGITIPDVSQFVTSGDVKTQIEDYHYITSAAIPTSNTAFTNDAGYLTEHQSLSAYSTTDEVETMIESATTDFVTSGEVETQIENKGYATVSAVTSALTTIENELSEAERVTSEALNQLEDNKADKTDIPDVSQFVTSGEVDTMIDAATSDLVTEAEIADFVTSGEVETQIESKGYVTESAVTSAITNVEDELSEAEQVTSAALNQLNNNKQDVLISGENIKTINNQSILGSGNIDIQGGGGGEQFVELTKAQYQSLTGYAENTTYIITDADTVDLNDYALESAVTSAITDINTALSGKTDKVTVSGNSGRQFPRWNAQGVVTGTTGSTCYEQSLNINGTSKTMIQTTNSSFGTIYAPTSVGTKNQVLLSNGSGAPVWSGYKFVFCSQSDYDNLATKDATTIYFIIDEN